jgi:hypothetical protein
LGGWRIGGWSKGWLAGGFWPKILAGQALGPCQLWRFFSAASITLFLEMLAHEIFQQASSALSHRIIAWFRTDERPVYKAAVAAMAQQRKMRPVYILEKKTKEQQEEWMLENLRLKSSEAVGENFLQIWLMKSRQPMLVHFLNALGVRHDGKGAVDGDLPPSFDPEVTKKAVAELAERFAAEEVAVYLNLFQLQQPNGWPELTAALEANPSVRLGA